MQLSRQIPQKVAINYSKLGVKHIGHNTHSVIFVLDWKTQSLKQYMLKWIMLMFFCLSKSKSSCCVSSKLMLETLGIQMVYPIGVLISVVAKINDQTAFQSILASRKRFKSFTNLLFMLLWLFMRRLSLNLFSSDIFIQIQQECSYFYFFENLGFFTFPAMLSVGNKLEAT